MKNRTEKQVNNSETSLREGFPVQYMSKMMKHLNKIRNGPHEMFCLGYTHKRQNTHSLLVKTVPQFKTHILPWFLVQSMACILHLHHTRKELILLPLRKTQPERKMELKALIHWINTSSKKKRAEDRRSS